LSADYVNQINKEHVVIPYCDSAEYGVVNIHPRLQQKVQRTRFCRKVDDDSVLGSERSTCNRLHSLRLNSE
ncbi:MAG: hypothetical protein ACEY3F_05150, partial [Wolbachia sp.]